LSRPAARERTERLLGLHVLADDDPRWKLGPAEQAAAACRGGASVVQLRAKHVGDREALACARRIRELCRDAGALFVVNDRFDLALLARADGVHLGQEDVPPDALPEPARRALMVGRSTHTLDEVRRAAAEPVDYVAFGPVFGTSSKPTPHPATGLAALAEAVALAAPRPVVAIGGIGPEQVAAVAAAGAGAAVISAVAAAADPEAATRELVARLAAGRRR
jgi:thiamine-phosphate pyrophosphorylase